MKHKTLFLLLSVTTVSTTVAARPHLDPEMTGAEYRRIFKSMEHNKSFQQRLTANPLNQILTIGKRNLDWVEMINSKRDAEHKLQLTTPETTPAYPIDAPGMSNPAIIQSRLGKLKEQMPKAMADVMFSNNPLPDYTMVDDETFTQHARTMNRIYEAASRWLLEEPYLDELKRNAAMDIRGYYFLNKEPDLKNKLEHWSSLDEATQNKYSQWLVSECINTTADITICQTDLTAAINTKKIYDYHQKYVSASAQVFKDYFELQNPRPEVIWNYKNPNIMQMPFTQTDRTDVQDWFKLNVEDEFHVNNWSLKINFSRTDHLAKLEFVPGTTPHVNALGGDTIYMDANRTLDDYEVSWTIRHEFAHILGFPDCYVEFYDEKSAAVINYQIDITNLMCSRRGHLQEKHYEQMKKYYYQETRNNN